MIVNVVGLLEDGSSPADGYPINARRALRVSKGQDVTVALTVVTPQGVLVSLGAPATLVLTVKKSPLDAVAVLAATPTVVGSVASFELPAATFKQQDPGMFVWDVWLTASGRRDPVIPISPLHLEAAATPPP